VRTFAELLTIMRREVVTEAADSGGFDDTTDLYPMLYNASSEIAAMLSFPVATESGLGLAAGATTLATPADLAWPRTLAFYGDELALVPYSMLVRKGSVTGRLPRFYAYDPRRGGNIEVAPAPADPVPMGAIVLEYTRFIDPATLTPGDLAWDGLFSDFQHLIPLRAGVNAWDSVGEAEQSQYFEQRFMNGLQVFAARLGITDVGNLIVPRENRDDRGAR
jgi:hypothetical protein